MQSSQLAFELKMNDNNVLTLFKDGNSVFAVDFLAPQIHFRTKGGTDSEFIVKAFSVAKSDRPKFRILDLTGGWGLDSYLLFRAGFQVKTIEQNPFVFQLLEDGIRRLKLDPRVSEESRNRWQCYQGDSADYISKFEVDGVFLDPMFEVTSKSIKSSNRKSIVLLRELIGISQELSSDSQNQLINAVADKKFRKVVIKGPDRNQRSAEISKLFLERGYTTRSLEGKSARFDIFALTQTQGQDGTFSF